MHNRNIVLNIEEHVEKIKGLTLAAKPRLHDESLGSFIKGIGSIFSGKIKKVGEALGFYGKKGNQGPSEFNDPSAFVEELSRYRKQVDKAANANYGTWEKTRIPTVPGLTTNIVDATDKTIQMIAKLNEVLEPKLDGLDNLVSKVLADESYRMSTRPIIHDKTTSKIIDELHKKIGSFMSTKKMEDTVLLYEIFPNTRCIKDCFEKLIGTASHGGLAQLNIYKQKIDTIVEKIDFLVAEINKRPDMNISKVVLKELSEETEEVAELVTIGMNIFWLFNQICGVIRVVADNIK